MPAQFEKLSEKYLNETDLAYRKSLGQYFTPRKLRDQLLARLPQLNNAAILDPSCGSGEFLLSAGQKYPDAELHGWEIDRQLVNLSRRLVPAATVLQADALVRDTTAQYDLVIGNPPYFEFKPAADLRQRYGCVLSGRPNIFSMFIKLGLDLLVEGGFLAYVVPPSMNNGAYFSRLRQYIIAHANIEHLSILDSPQHFDGAIQSVMLLILRKSANKGDFLFSRNGITIFSEAPARLRRAFRNKSTLFESGYTVHTGRIVWNQHKEKLTDTPTGSIPLIRPFNITPEGLRLGNKVGKSQYIRFDQFSTGPAVVVNRVTGTASTARLKAAVVPKGLKFLAENHVNVILPPSETSNSAKTIEKQLRSIRDTLNSAHTLESIRLITGNTQVSRTELERLLPIPPLK